MAAFRYAAEVVLLGMKSHFFPRSWLEKHREDSERINHVANITLVDGFLNKDDYAKFFDARCRAISRELIKLIVPQKINQVGTTKRAEGTVVEQEE